MSLMILRSDGLWSALSESLVSPSPVSVPLLLVAPSLSLCLAATVEIDLLFGDKMRRAAQLPTLSWHGRSSAVGLPPCSLPPQDLGRVLDGGPIRHGVDSQQLVVPGSPPTACTGIQQGCQLVCPAAGTFWWCWLSPFVLHPAPPMSPHDLLLLKRLRIIPQSNSTNCSYLTSYCCTPRVVAASPKCFQQWRFSTSSAGSWGRRESGMMVEAGNS